MWETNDREKKTEVKSKIVNEEGDIKKRGEQETKRMERERKGMVENISFFPHVNLMKS